MAHRVKALGLFNKLSRKSLNDLSEWNKNDEKLMKSIEESDLKEIQSLLQKKKVCSTKLDPQGHSGLHVAAMRNKFDVVQLLIAYSADVTAIDFQGRTALHCAAWHGASEVIEVLSHCKEDAWPLDDSKMCALHHACIGGSVDCVLSLIRKFPRDMQARDQDGRTPLFYAAQIGHLQVCKELLDRGASVDVQDNFGCTPLMYAAESGNRAICELCIKKGANVDLKDNLGHSAEWHAMDAGHTSLRSLMMSEPCEEIDQSTTERYTNDRPVSPIPEESESLSGDVSSLSLCEDVVDDLTNIAIMEFDVNHEDGSTEQNSQSQSSSDDETDIVTNLSGISYTLFQVNPSRTMSASDIHDSRGIRESAKELRGGLSGVKGSAQWIGDDPPEIGEGDRNCSLADSDPTPTIKESWKHNKKEQINGACTSGCQDLLMMNDGVSLSTDESDDEGCYQVPIDLAVKASDDHFSDTCSSQDDCESQLLSEETTPRNKSSSLDENRKLEVMHSNSEPLQDFEFGNQVSILNSRLMEETKRNEELLHHLVQLKAKLETRKITEVQDKEVWTYSSDDDALDLPDLYRKEAEKKPVAKVSGQPRKLSWREENREIAKLKQEIQNLEQQKDTLTQTVVRLQASLNESQDNYKQMQSQAKVAQSQHDLKSQEVESLMVEVQLLQKQISVHQSTCSETSSRSLRKEIEKREKEVERLRSKLELYHVEYRKVRDKLKRRDQNEKKMLKDRQSMMKKLDEVTKRMKEAERSVESTQKISELRQQNAELVSRCQQFADEISNLTDELEDARFELSEMDHQVEDSHELSTLAQLEVEALEKQIRLMQDGALSAQKEIFKESTIRSLQLQITKLQSQLAETAINHQNALEVYRNHLILASRNRLHPEVQRALDAIIELRIT